MPRFEILRKEGLAGDTFRRFTKLDNVFQDMQAYVNSNAGKFVFGRGNCGSLKRSSRSV